MKHLILLFTLLAPLTVAQDLALSVVSATDDTIRVQVTDTLAPRPVTLEVRSIPDGIVIGEIGRTTPVTLTLPGLTSATNYDITARASDEAVATQQYTTLLGFNGVQVTRAAYEIGAQPLVFLRVVAASSEAVSEAAVNLQRDILRAGLVAVRAERDRLEDEAAAQRRSGRPTL